MLLKSNFFIFTINFVLKCFLLIFNSTNDIYDILINADLSWLLIDYKKILHCSRSELLETYPTLPKLYPNNRILSNEVLHFYSR